jgi:hypothetical protein
MATKKCNVCGKEKSVDSFHKCSTCKFGRQGTCKICKSQKDKMKRGTDNPREKLQFPRMYPTTIDDYREMFLFLKDCGYDPTKNIHEQFCLRYGLTPKERNEKDVGRFSYQDCFNNEQ